MAQTLVSAASRLVSTPVNFQRSTHYVFVPNSRRRLPHEHPDTGFERKLERIAAYIENNQVKAGLVTRAKDYLWSSARKRTAGAETSLGAAG